MMKETAIIRPSASEGKGRDVLIFRPGWRFPSVSTTGIACSLMCDHCRGRYLRGMADVSAKGSLYDLGMRHWKVGGTGLLISGGCDSNGAVHLSDHTIDEAKRLKEDTGLVLNLHTGLLDRKGADRVAKVRPDMVSLDIVADREVTNEVFHLDAGPEDYARTYSLLIDNGIKVVPHIITGLRPSMKDLEVRAVELIAPFEPEAAVLISFIPTKGTPLEGRTQAPPSLVSGTASYMRMRLSGRLFLGCMRPKGDPDLEIEVLRLGFDGLVLPSARTLAWMVAQGFSVTELEQCCASL